MPLPTNNRERWLRWGGPALLGAWLLGWMAVSWPAIQDDALIHLRYADNLYLHHFITYDGVHPDYGASSLLYVGILAVLRGFTESPQLPRATSSMVHLVLFAGLALAFAKRLPRPGVARLTAFGLLALLVMPSAVRWLDDGMETGLAMSIAMVLAWLIQAGDGSKVRALLLGCAAFLAVMLRTELLLLCAVGFVILMSHRTRNAEAAAVLVGAASSVGFILATMHVLLPDTAVAKSHGIGHWFSPVHDTAITLGGAFSFGVGMLVFWLLTLLLVVRRRGVSPRTALANCFCPAVLALSALRGQEIQGARYFAWTFAFPIVWNILELANEGAVESNGEDRRGIALLYVFLGLLALGLPFESVAMHRVLTRRAETMRVFESQHLEVLRERRGVASDIGYIGYFSGARICDLAGLVNGRSAARLSSVERDRACADTSPDFLFVNGGQLASMKGLIDVSAWQVCGRYDFSNVSTRDSHSLLVRPEIAAEVCRATGRPAIAVATSF